MDLYLLKSSAGKSFVRRPLITVVVSKRPHQTAFHKSPKKTVMLTTGRDCDQSDMTDTGEAY